MVLHPLLESRKYLLSKYFRNKLGRLYSLRILGKAVTFESPSLVSKHRAEKLSIHHGVMRVISGVLHMRFITLCTKLDFMILTNIPLLYWSWRDRNWSKMKGDLLQFSFGERLEVVSSKLKIVKQKLELNSADPCFYNVDRKITHISLEWGYSLVEHLNWYECSVQTGLESILYHCQEPNAKAKWSINLKRKHWFGKGLNTNEQN